MVGGLDTDLTARDELRERAVHVDHAFGRGGLDDGVDLVRALLAYQIRDRFGVDEELVGGDEAAGEAREGGDDKRQMRMPGPGCCRTLSRRLAPGMALHPDGHLIDEEGR